MAAPKGNGRDSREVQPVETLTKYTADFIARAPTSQPHLIGSLLTRHNTVIAEVLSRLLNGETLTGMDAVSGCSTTRLAATIHSLAGNYGWTIDHVDMDVGTNDGRVALIRAYFLPRGVIRKAFDAGALEFCRSVKAARAATRKDAAKAKEEAHKSNVARSALRDLFQGASFGSDV